MEAPDLVELCLLTLVGSGSVWGYRRWQARSQLRHQDGRKIPGKPARPVVGNLPEIYQAPNRLTAYHNFHTELGEVVQIFWLWRRQISMASYPMARHVLQQGNYVKYPPNRLLQQLYGSSVLTAEGEAWKRQRRLLQEVFSRSRVEGFQPLFLTYAQQLADRWQARIQAQNGSASWDIHPELSALFLDLIGKTALGIDLGAMSGSLHVLQESLTTISRQSLRPVHQFLPWWRQLPLADNARLQQAFETVDTFLFDLIRQRREVSPREEGRADILDLLVQETDPPLSDQEVRDNLLAILLNGHETVATGLALTLHLLARHPAQQAQAQAEVESVIPADLSKLPFLRAILWEALRLYPPMAGLQRISVKADQVEGWSIPAAQVVGIPLQPLHQDPRHFGQHPDHFRPERYLPEHYPTEACPHAQLPLSFGDGPRRCLGETFALHEMLVVLAVLLQRFEFAATGEVNPELGRFGLFISMFPKGGVTLSISNRLTEVE